MGWAVGDGAKVSFWLDPWLGLNSIISDISGPLYLNEDKITVKNLIDDTGKWNFDQITFHLPDTLKEKI